MWFEFHKGMKTRPLSTRGLYFFFLLLNGMETKHLFLDGKHSPSHQFASLHLSGDSKWLTLDLGLFSTKYCQN